MLALCLMLSGTHYAKNYAGIIGRGLAISRDQPNMLHNYAMLQCLNYYAQYYAHVKDLCLKI